MAIEAGEPVDALFDFELPSAPYPGLRPFDVHEWPIFFGRETATNEVAGQLIWQQLVVVHGDPGCGKTSFIRAGVIAQLEQQYARSEMRWRSITIRPHEAPLKNLAQALANVDSFPSEADRLVDLQRILNLGRHAPAVLAERLCRRDSDPICIHVDQFEDLFTFAGNRDRKEAQLFVDVFVGLHENPPAGIHAILTMSSRYLGDCSQFAGLTEAIDHAQYPLERIAQLDLISAILEPARIYGGDIARELAERLVADAGDRPNQLPLIQHALMFLLRRKLGSSDRAVATKSWQLGLSDYGGGGGLGTLLSAHADEVVNQAAPDPNRKRLVQGLFRALLDVSPKGDVVRRPRTFKELLEATGSDAQTLKCLIDQFRAEGVSILTPYGDAALNPNTLVCISCDVLVEFWQRLSALRRLLQAPRDFTSGRVEAQTHNMNRGRGDRSLPRKGFDVFLAYAREDKGRIGELAGKLNQNGYSVFWDSRIPPGETWRSYIFKALSESRCVVPAWSHHSIKSDWVLEEAEEGKRQGKLVPVLFEVVDPPFGFRFIQAADLSMWKPESPSDVLEGFLDKLAVLVRPGEA